MNGSVVDPRVLRRQIRRWRSDRASLRFADVAADAYIAVFAATMFTAIAASVLREVRTQSMHGCVSLECMNARQAVPWLSLLAIAATVMAVARLVGPVFVAPAEVAWILAAPVDRGNALRPRLLGTLFVSLLVGALTGIVIGTLVSATSAVIVLWAGTAGFSALASTGLAGLDQIGGKRASLRSAWCLSVLAWSGALVLTVGLPTPAISVQLVPFVCVLAIVVLVAGLFTGRFWRHLDELPRTRLAASGAFASSLSGALMGLNFALLYDVVLDKTWRDAARVRPRRGFGRGLCAVAHRDLIRLVRTPSRLGVLAATLVVPYFAAILGLGSATAFIAALACFLVGIRLCSGLRVLTRTPGLARCMPFSPAQLRMGGSIVPAVLLIAWGTMVGPAMYQALPAGSWSGSWVLGVCVGAAGLAGALRWTTAEPPDFGRPMLSTPMGAVPPSLYGALFRGFDAVLLATAPILVFHGLSAALVSLLLSAGIITVTMR